MRIMANEMRARYQRLFDTASTGIFRFTQMEKFWMPIPRVSAYWVIQIVKHY